MITSILNQSVLINEEIYNEMLSCLPPIYIKSINGYTVNEAFAVSEAFCHTDRTVVLDIYYEYNGEYYSCLCEVFTKNNSHMFYYNDYEFTTGNIALIYKKAPK